MEGLWALGEWQGCGQLSFTPQIQHPGKPSQPCARTPGRRRAQRLGTAGGAVRKALLWDPERQRVRQGCPCRRCRVPAARPGLALPRECNVFCTR